MTTTKVMRHPPTADETDAAMTTTLLDTGRGDGDGLLVEGDWEGLRVLVREGGGWLGEGGGGGLQFSEEILSFGSTG